MFICAFGTAGEVNVIIGGGAVGIVTFESTLGIAGKVNVDKSILVTLPTGMF
jgi:hypothetical protein